MARTNKYTSLNFNDIYEKKIINPNNNNSSTPTTTSSSTRSPSSSFSSAAYPHKSYSLSASSRIGHGGMLVLSRPSPKPQPQPQPQPQPSPPLSLSSKQKPLQQPQPQPQPRHQQPLSNSVAFPPILSPTSSKSSDSDSISLRPQGKTGGGPSFPEREFKVDFPSPKSNKFVPPHLRPGFVAREVTPLPEFQKPRQGNYRPGSAHGNFHGSPNRYAEDGRPKSGGGYERRMRGVGPGPGPGPGAGVSPVGVDSDLFFPNRPRSGGSRPSSSG